MKRVQYCHKLCDKIFKIPLMNHRIPNLAWENIIYRKTQKFFSLNHMLIILNNIWK